VIQAGDRQKRAHARYDAPCAHDLAALKEKEKYAGAITLSHLAPREDARCHSASKTRVNARPDHEPERA
jgi:hypothetical protein